MGKAFDTHRHGALLHPSSQPDFHTCAGILYFRSYSRYSAGDDSDTGRSKPRHACCGVFASIAFGDAAGPHAIFYGSSFHLPGVLLPVRHTNLAVSVHRLLTWRHGLKTSAALLRMFHPTSHNRSIRHHTTPQCPYIRCTHGYG